jgi:hypothetical protein
MHADETLAMANRDAKAPAFLPGLRSVGVRERFRVWVSRGG